MPDLTLARMKGIAVLKTVMLQIILAGVLAGLSVFAGAETPTTRHKAAGAKSSPVSEEQRAASAALTARLQAEAIADAARSTPATAVQSAANVPEPVVTQPLRTQPAVLPVRPAFVASADGLNADELAIAERVHKGHLSCELGVSVRLEADASQPGYFHLQGKGFRYRMRPVTTSTGTIRLEDTKAGAVWLQLANKSMLMDQKKGRRVADDCANAEQTAFAEHMKTNPLPKLFDTTGMGR